MAFNDTDVAAVLSDPRLSRVSDSLARLAMRSIRLSATLSDESHFALGDSKLGGLPDLPIGLEWPTGRLNVPPFSPGAIRSYSGVTLPADAVIPLPFIAQIRLSDINTVGPQLSFNGFAGEGDSLLPPSGSLYFFYNTVSYGYDWLAPANWRVFWYDGDGSGLQRLEYPSDIPEECQYQPCALTFTAEVTLPHVETCFISDRGDAGGVLALTEDEWDVYSDLLYEQRANHKIHQMLGHSDDYQPYMMESGYWRVRRQFFPEMPSMEKFALDSLQPELETGRLLLQVDAESNGMEFGRGGRLYFFIRSQDLAARDFSRVWVTE